MASARNARSAKETIQPIKTQQNSYEPLGHQRQPFQLKTEARTWEKPKIWSRGKGVEEARFNSVLYVHACMHTYIRIYIYTYTYMYTELYACMSLSTHIYIDVHTQTHAYVHIRICVHNVYTRSGVYGFVNMYTRIIPAPPRGLPGPWPYPPWRRRGLQRPRKRANRREGPLIQGAPSGDRGP